MVIRVFITKPLTIGIMVVRVGIGHICCAVVPRIYVGSAITKLFTTRVKESTLGLIRAIPAHKDILIIFGTITK